MPFALEQKKFGFKKEASRGISENAPIKFLAVGNEAEMRYNTVLIANDKLRGTKEDYPSAVGIKEGTGTLPAIDVEADTIGDLLYGSLGKVTSAQPDASGSPTVFRHTFLPLTDVRFPSFTFFADRGLGVKRYPLTVFKKLSLSGAVDGKALAAADVLFKSEEPASAFNANFGSPKPLMFFQTDFKVDGSSDQNVRSWNLSIDNGSVAQRTLNQSRDAKDIVSHGTFAIQGGFDIYFETEANRQKFLDGLSAAIDILLTGDVIHDVYKNELDIHIPKAKYSAYPYGTLEGLLGAAVTFKAELDATLGYSLQMVLTNSVSGY